MFIKHAKSKITQVFNDVNEFRGFVKRSGKSVDRNLFIRVANKLKEVELPDDLENYIILRNRAISSMEYWGANQNFDAFPDKELRTKYSTFRNCRIDVDHICDDEERDIIGIVLDSVYIEPKVYRRGRFIDFDEHDIQTGDQVTGGYIENLWAIHKGRAEAHTPGLCTAILNGEITDSSMGLMAGEAECSVCGKRYTTSKKVCIDHIGIPYFEPEFDNRGRQVYKTDGNGNKLVDKTGNWIKEGEWLIDYSGKKGQYHNYKGQIKLAYEVNHDIEFFEDSVIKSEGFAIKSGSKAEAGGEGADNRAKILEHIPTEGFRDTKKKSLLDMIKRVAINESLLKDEYMKLGEEPQDITETKEELQNESIEKLEEGESNKVMTNYSKYKDLVDGNSWEQFKALVIERSGMLLPTSKKIALKNFYKKALNEQVVFKIKEMRNNRMKDKEISDKLLEMGYDKPTINEGLQYDKHFGVGEVVGLKKRILEDIRRYHKAIIDVPNMDSGMMSDRMDTQKHVDDVGIGQKPTEVDESRPENNSLGYGKTGNKDSQLYIKLSELEEVNDIIKSDLLDETKEQPEDGKIVYNDEELTKESQLNKKMADKKDKLNNGRGIDRYDGKYNDKEQDLSQKKVNVEDYKDLKEKDSEHSTSDSGAVQKDRKLPKKQTDNRIGDSTSDFKESVDGSSKTYPNPYKEDLKTKEMIWKIESLQSIKRAFDPEIKRGDTVLTAKGNLGTILSMKGDDYLVGFEDGNNYMYKASEFSKTFKVNEQADDLKESYDDNRDNFGFENAVDLQKSQEKNNNSDSKGNLSDELDKDYIDKHTDRKKTSAKDKTCPDCGKECTNEECKNCTKKTSTIADYFKKKANTIADYFNKDEQVDETASGGQINNNGIPNNDAISNNIINQAKLKKYADDWSPETNYDKKAEEDFNLGLKPNDDFKVKNEPKDGIVKEEEGGGDYMTPIAKKALKIGDVVMISPDNDNENYDNYRNEKLRVTHVAHNRDEHPGDDEGIGGQRLYDLELIDGDEFPFSLYDYELVKVGKKVKSITDEPVDMPMNVDGSEVPTEEGDGFKMDDGDEITDIPQDIEETIKQKETDLLNSLTKQKWVILTATKEDLAKNNKEFKDKPGLLPENLERNEQLKSELEQLGYSPIEVKGVYKKTYYGDSYLVYDMKLRDAFALGVKYEQESILIPEGLLYTTGVSEGDVGSYNLQQATLEPVKINPNTGHFDYTIGDEAENEEFYSTFKIGDSMVSLSLGLNYGKYIPYWEFPEYVRESLTVKQENQEAEEEHTELDSLEHGGTDLLDVDLDKETDSDNLSEDAIDSEEEAPSFDDIDGDINLDDMGDEDEPKDKRSKKIVGGALPTNPQDFSNYIGKQVEKRDRNTGAIEGIDTIKDLKTIKNDNGTKDVGVITNNNELETTKDYNIQTTSVLEQLMAIKFDDTDLDIEKKTAGIDELDLNIDLDDDEKYTTTAEAEVAMGADSFFSDTETDKSKGETTKMHQKKKGSLGKVNPHADRTKLAKSDDMIDDNFFMD